MAVSWGAESKHMRAGIEGYMSPGSLTPSTMSVQLIFNLYAQAVAWGFGDDQVGVLSNALSESIAYRMNSANGATTTVYLGTRSITVPTSVSSATTRTLSLTLTDIYITSGANPYVTVSITVPKRPPGVWVAVAGAWQAALAVKVAAGGAWQNVVRVWGAVSGLWK